MTNCGSAVPDGNHTLDEGANCQRYAHAVLAYHDVQLPPWRSSTLWQDAALTIAVAPPYRPLDLMVFNATADAFGAHVRVWNGDGVLHLCRQLGRPAVWPLERFCHEPRYRVFVGAKRVDMAP